MRDSMSEIRSRVTSNLKMSAETMKRRKDEKATTIRFVEGDQVWLFNPRRRKGQSPKLSSSWEGLYVVVKVLSAVTYMIRAPGKTACKVVHFNRLWRMKGQARFSWKDGPRRAGGEQDLSGPLHSLPGFPDADADAASAAGRVESGISPALDADRSRDVSLQEGPSVSPGAGSAPTEIPRMTASITDHPGAIRTLSADGRRRSERRRVRPDYLSYP